ATLGVYSDDPAAGTGSLSEDDGRARPRRQPAIAVMRQRGRASSGFPGRQRLVSVGGASSAYAGSGENGQAAGVKALPRSRSAVASCRDIGEPGAKPYPPTARGQP